MKNKLVLTVLGLLLIQTSLVKADGNCKMAAPTVTVGPVGVDDSFVEYGLGQNYIPITIVPHTQSGTCKHVIVHTNNPSFRAVLQNMGATVVNNSTWVANFRIYFDATEFQVPLSLIYDFHDTDRVSTGIYYDIPVKLVLSN